MGTAPPCGEGWSGRPRGQPKRPQAAPASAGVVLSRAGGKPSLLKTFPAVNWPALSRFEGNGCFFPTLRAGSCGFHSVNDLPVRGLTSFRLTGPATFGFVLEALIGVEELFPCSENELCPAIHTLENPIPVLHRCTPRSNRAPPAASTFVVAHREAGGDSTLWLLSNPYSCSCLAFLRALLRAKAALTRFFSPGFK